MSAKRSSAARTGPGETPARERAVRQLKRIEGQIRGIARMVEENRYCGDVLVQVSAAGQSLRSVASVLLRDHLEHCVTQSLRSGDERRARELYDELTGLFGKYGG
jgi:CsoR family transcriptional regulator, copper-sensing transcriptional repressor